MLKQANAVDEAVNPLTQGKYLKLKQIQIEIFIQIQI